MNSKVTALSISIALAAAVPALAGGYDGVLETYTLQRSDGSAITMYERPDTSSPVLASIPSGTVVRLIKGNPEGWILVDYNDVQGCVMGSDGNVLCIGNIEAGVEE